MTVLIRVAVFVSSLTLLMQVSCKDNGIEYARGRLELIGFEDKLAWRIKAEATTLYVCGGKDGLWCYDVSNPQTDWKNLGFADTNQSPYPPLPNHWVSDIDSYGDTLLLAISLRIKPPRYLAAGIWRSTNKGITWTRSDSGLTSEEYPYSSIWSIMRSPNLPNIVMSVDEGNVHARSTDGGQTWTGASDAGIGYGTWIAWNPYKAEETWKHGMSATSEPVLFKSTDAGLNWSDRRPFLGGDNSINSLAFDAGNPDMIYFACNTGVFASTNSGEEWREFHYEQPPFLLRAEEGVPFFSIVTHPRKSGEIYTAAGNKLFISSDYGHSFLSISTPASTPIRSLFYVESFNALVLGTGSGVFLYHLQ